MNLNPALSFQFPPSYDYGLRRVISRHFLRQHRNTVNRKENRKAGNTVSLAVRSAPPRNTFLLTSPVVIQGVKQSTGKKSSPSTGHGDAWERGGISPTHSRPHYTGVSGQRNAPGKDSWLDRRLGGPQSWTGQRLEEKLFCLCQGSNLDRPVVQPVVKRLYWLRYHRETRNASNRTAGYQFKKKYLRRANRGCGKTWRVFHPRVFTSYG
jgi:hypothetical protein